MTDLASLSQLTLRTLRLECDQWIPPVLVEIIGLAPARALLGAH